MINYKIINKPNNKSKMQNKEKLQNLKNRHKNYYKN